jgi:hypothetical protein
MRRFWTWPSSVLYLALVVMTLGAAPPAVSAEESSILAEIDKMKAESERTKRQLLPLESRSSLVKTCIKAAATAHRAQVSPPDFALATANDLQCRFESLSSSISNVERALQALRTRHDALSTK